MYNDTDTFSSCNSPTGPFPGFPVPLEGDDVSALIEQHRDELPMSDQMLTFDPPRAHRAPRAADAADHAEAPARERGVHVAARRSSDRRVRRPRRVRVHRRVRPAVRHARRRRPARRAGARPRAVPRAARRRDRASRPAPSASTGDEALAHNPLEFLYEQFTAYVEDRRREPRDDVLTGMATATFPDGSIPEAIDVARIAANLFAAGQETTVRLFGSGAAAPRRRPRAPAAAARPP